MQINNILNVCVGNICRSPMAVGFFAAYDVKLQTHSAGISAVIGSFADLKAQDAMLRLHSIDIGSHIARQLNLELIQQADLVLVMTQNQVHHLCKIWPTATGKVFRLGHWQSIDIVDPYGQKQQDFDQCSQLIRTSVENWIRKIN